MNIWVMRHGEASFQAVTDRQRTLTDKGCQMAYQQGQWLAKRLEDQQIMLDKVLVSPYLRAQQTLAEVEKGMQAVGYLKSFANSKSKISIVETWNGITPSGIPRLVVDYLSTIQQSGEQNVLLISHLPLVYDLVQLLTHSQNQVHFYPATIAEIRWVNGLGKLIQSVFPQ